ncbi:MAG TPA: hypothetical protein VGM86_28105 [Thermoanaerobaculia bacterium]|jgi:hypothetical protein
MKALKEDPGSRYVLRFDRGRFALAERKKKASALTASTEDERLSVPVRIAAFLVGLLFAAFGLGLMALVVFGIREARSFEWAGVLLLIVITLVVGTYGVDLLGRGITGRPWSRRFWQAAERRLPAFRSWLCLAVLGAFFCLLVLAGLPREGWRSLAVLMIPLAMLAQVVCHEIGHLSAAGAVGYRPLWLSAGPLLVEVDGPRPRVALSRSWMMLFGGLAVYVPVRRTRGKDLWVVAAGSLANLLTAALALDVLGWPTSESGFWDTFLRTFIGFGIAVGLINLIPFPRMADGSAMDGRQLLDLLRGR